MNNYSNEVLEIVDDIQFEKITEHPNILIAAGFWEADRYMAAKACYKFMRMIDDLIDDRKAEGKKISYQEKLALSEKVRNWIDILNSDGSGDSFINDLNAIIKRYKIPVQLFHNFARSMQFDIDHNGFASFDEFLSYSEGASVAPASVFVHLCCLGKEKEEFVLPPFDVIEIARPCAIFSYIVHIIRDFQKDQKNNLNYFAKDILAANGLRPEDLREIADGRPIPGSFRNVIRQYHSYAQYYGLKTLMVIDKVASQVNGRYMLSLQIIYNLYLQVFDRINVENGTFTKEELNPTPMEIKQRVLDVIKRY